MLDPASFRDHTTYLPAGRNVRVDHDCGGGRTLKVEHKEDGYSAYCWRCSDHGWIPHPRPSLSERLAKLAAIRNEEYKDSSPVVLPQPMQPDPQQWPAVARVWLYKAGLSNDDITALGFYYCERTARVVMPVYDNGKLVYWQARGFDKARAKYINPNTNKDHLVARYGSGDVLVLTEDMLSAYKVGRVAEGWACMGTSLSDAMLARIASQNRPVLFMFDPDAAGMKARLAARSKLGAMGIPTRIVRLNKDPKLLSTQELHNAIYHQ